MASPASLDLLPQELLDIIVQHLSVTSLARLTSCNKRMYRRVEPRLYSQDGIRDRAMNHACRRGCVSAIRRLVSVYCAPVSTVDIRWSGRSTKVPTLYLAASRQQVEAFQALLELGARIDVPGVPPRCVHRLVSEITRPVDDDWRILRLFFDAQLHTQVNWERQEQSALPLLRLLARASPTPPVDPLRLLLSLGADPNTLLQPSDLASGRKFTPLTAAMSQHCYDPTEILAILLAHGADINGPTLEQHMDQARHSPIFVAAELMATEGTKWMQFCLKHGADINQHAQLLDQTYYHGRTTLRGPTGYYTATPALAYVLSLRHTTFDIGSQCSAIDPLQSLSYLISHGATIDPPPGPCKRPPRVLGRLSSRPWGQWHLDAPWCIEILIWRWGLDQAESSPNFRDMLRYLLQHSVSRGHPGEVLFRCETACTRWAGVNCYRGYELARKWKKQTRKRRDLKDVLYNMRVHLLDYLVKELKVAPTTLLKQYLLARGEQIYQEEQTTYAVIEYLVAEGGDINATIAEDGSTALHHLCQAYYPAIEDAWFSDIATTAKKELLRFLIQKGADASIVVAGQTAWEMIVGPPTREYHKRLVEWARTMGYKEIV